MGMVGLFRLPAASLVESAVPGQDRAAWGEVGRIINSLTQVGRGH